VPAGYVNSGQHVHRGLGIPLRLHTRAVSPHGAAVRWLALGHRSPVSPPGPAGKFCGVCGRLANGHCPDDAIRGCSVASIRLTALTRPRIASSWGAQAVRCGGLTTRPLRPRTAPWGTRWGQMDGHPAPARVLAGGPLGRVAPRCLPNPRNRRPAPLVPNGLPGLASQEASARGSG
jgi:hypothetical protein